MEMIAVILTSLGMKEITASNESAEASVFSRLKVIQEVIDFFCKTP